MKRNFRHGYRHHPYYYLWNHIVRRCNYKNNKAYKNYGGRGIKICKRWLNVANFIEDMGARPIGYTLDRIDNNKGYSKQNCRWASWSTQHNNRRDNKRYLYKGKNLTLAQWSRELGIGYMTMYSRLNRSKFSLDKVFAKINSR